MFLKELDFISDMNSIYFKGRKNHPNRFAGLLSVLGYAVVAAFAVYFSLDVLFKKNPTSYFYKRFIPDVGYYYLNTSSIFHYFQLLDPNDGVRMDFQSFQIIGSETYVDAFLLDVDYSKEDYWIYDLCTIEDAHEYAEIIEDLQYEQGVCLRKFYNHTTQEIITTDDPNFPYPNIRHGTGCTIPDKPNQGYGVYIARCSNTMPHLDKPCKSEDEIDEEQSKLLRVKMTMIDNDFDVTLYKNPVVSYMLDTKNHLTGDTVTNNNLNFNPVHIFTDDGLIFPTNKTKSSFRLDFNEKITYEKLPETRILSAWYFLMQNRAETYDRTYPKFQETLASVGGTSKAILMIAAIINWAVNQWIVTLDIQIMLEALGIDYSREKPDKFKNKMTMNTNSNTNYNQMNNSWLTNNNQTGRGNNMTQTNNYLVNPSSMNRLPLNQVTNAQEKTPPQNQIVRKTSMLHHRIGFCSFLKSFLATEGKVKVNINLMNTFWKSKVSEENMVQMHLRVYRIVHQMPELMKDKNNVKINELIKEYSGKKTPE